MTNSSLRPPRPQRLRRLGTTLTFTAAFLLSGASAVLAGTPNVSPNPVAPGVTVTVTPDTACRNAVLSIPGTVWLVTNSIGIDVVPLFWGGNPASFTFVAPPIPGTYTLSAIVTQGVNTACGGATPVVVATGAGTPILEPRPALGAALALAVGGGVVIVRRRSTRRHSA